MKILFVGATGNVGRQVVPLLAQSHTMVPAALGGGEVAGQAVSPLDLCDMDVCRDLLASVRPDAVVNCAISEYRKYKHRHELEYAQAYNQSMVEVNVRGVYHLYEAAALAKVRKFVQISSLAIHTGPPDQETVSVRDLPQPRDFYACTKLFGDNLGMVYSAQRDMSVTCLRLGQPYPVRPERELLWLKDPHARSLFVHVEDIASAIAGALHCPLPYSVHAVVSNADTRWVENPDVPELNYHPRFYFAPDGVYVRDARGHLAPVASSPPDLAENNSV